MPPCDTELLDAQVTRAPPARAARHSTPQHATACHSTPQHATARHSTPQHATATTATTGCHRVPQSCRRVP
eukprot:5684031-Prymnesium_polylepis.1